MHFLKAPLRRAAAASVMLISSLALRAEVPPAWSPMQLNTDVSDAEITQWKKQSDIRRAELAYLYALPPFLHMRQRFEWVRNFTRYMGDRGNPFGQFLLLRQPTGPATRDTMPNHDTLYGATFADLKASPMVLQVPDVPNRYFSLALLDASFYNFDYIGSRTSGQLGGNYLIAGPDWKGPVPPGIARVIHAPTNSINVYQRIYFRDNADVEAVHAIQDQIRMLPLARFLDPKAPAPLTDPQAVLANDPTTVHDPVELLRMANGYLGENPPPLQDQSLWEHFAPLGVGPGLSLPADSEQLDTLRQGAALAQQTLSALALRGSRTVQGWQLPPPIVGRRGGPGAMAFQAMTQLRSIGINIPEEAVYYTAYNDNAGQALHAGQRYTMRFEAAQLPPLQPGRFGFWSLTMYHRDTYRLVDNPAQKYVVRSGDALHFTADGSLTLLLQSTPPENPDLRANWLPTPAQGDFVLSLRVYVGGEEVVAGRFIPPPLQHLP